MRWITLDRAAQMLNRTPRQVRRLADEGVICSRKLPCREGAIGPREVMRVSIEDIEIIRAIRGDDGRLPPLRVLGELVEARRAK